MIKTAKMSIPRSQLEQLDGSVDVSACDKDKMTLLHFAVMNNHGEAMVWLLNRNPQLINMQNAQGKTALMLAVENQDLSQATQLVRILLEYNPDLTIKDTKKSDIFEYTKNISAITKILSESQNKQKQGSVLPSAPLAFEATLTPMLEEKTLVRDYSVPSAPPAPELVYPSLAQDKASDQNNKPHDEVKQDSTSRILSLTTTDVVPVKLDVLPKQSDVITVADIKSTEQPIVTITDVKPKEPQKSVIAMTARLFSKQLQYKMELLDLFDQLLDTADSRAILIPLIEAFNKSDFNGLMTTTGSAIHDQIAKQFVMELAKRDSLYKEVLQQYQNVDPQVVNVVKR